MLAIARKLCQLVSLDTSLYENKKAGMIITIKQVLSF